MFISQLDLNIDSKLIKLQENINSIDKNLVKEQKISFKTKINAET